MNWLSERPIAHRGLHDRSAGVPENSVVAFEAACTAGYGIELDTRLSRDGQVMVFHDRRLTRLTGSVAKFNELTASALTALRLEQTDHGIPTLADVLKRVAGRVPLLIEIKNNQRHAGPHEAAVAELLTSYKGTCAISSFNPYSVAWFGRHMPDLLRGQTSSLYPQKDIQTPWTVRTSLKHLTVNPISCPDFIVYHHRALIMRSPGWARRRGMPVLSYTIKTDDQLAQARRFADNVIFENIRP